MKYFDASLSLTKTKTPKEVYRWHFQERLKREFYNSPNWFTIQEETSFGSGIYNDVDVRIGNVISNETGSTLSDDFRVIEFMDVDHPMAVGWYYYFEDNFWICVNTEKMKSLTATGTVKRCHNVLKWMDDMGAIYEYPFTLGDYLIRENRNYATSGSALVSPSGIIEVHTQFNEFTNRIYPNMRFLLGNQHNWTAYRVQGGGVNNFTRLKTMDEMSTGLVKLSLAVDYVNEDVDDLILGIADKAGENYEIVVRNGYSINGTIGGTLQLDSVVTLNELSVTRPLSYSSSDTDILTVDENGLVTFVSSGSATVTVNISKNANVYKIITFSVSAVPAVEYLVKVTPDVNYVLLNEETEFEVNLFVDNVETPSNFTFTLNANTVPSENYTFTIVDGNHFKIKNIKKFLTDVLDVNCDDGFYSLDLSFLLKGAW